MNEIKRRDLLAFLGRSSVAIAALNALPGCVTASRGSSTPLGFKPILPTRQDDLVLAEGFRHEILLRYGQKISPKESFGFNNDYTAYRPFSAAHPLEGLLWVNHETSDPVYVGQWKPGTSRTKEQINRERKSVGGSIVHIRRDPVHAKWSVVDSSSYNRRLDGFTRIPFVSERPILGKAAAIGTFGNCAGGVTPWGTILTCEENYFNFVGEVKFENGQRKVSDKGDGYLTWLPHVDLPPEHYGWVVEVDVMKGTAKKLTGLGRFCHEGATTRLAADGRCVVYSGDDAETEHLYKFISAKPGSLEEGQLFVADLAQGKWLLLNRESHPSLKKVFVDQTELLIRTREAAKILGATPLDRPEDIEIDPHTGAVIVSLTNGKTSGNYFGSLLKIMEQNNDPLSLEFTSETFVSGGPESGFACPDNLAFDRKGNLWMTSDMAGTSMHKAPYEPFGNNGLFYIPMSGKGAGRAHQVASAPVGAELTGPTFSPDGRTLFLSVQHPGERGHQDPSYVSHWPDGGTSDPCPCVVTITGPALERLTQG